MVVRLDRADHVELRRIAFERRMPMSEIVRRAVHALVSSGEEQDFLLNPPDHTIGGE